MPPRAHAPPLSVAFASLAALCALCRFGVAVPLPEGSLLGGGGSAVKGQVSELPWAAGGGNASCGECIEVVDAIHTCCSNGTSGAATIAKLGAECHTLFPTSPSKVAVCERIANSSVELIEFIEKEATSLGWESSSLCAAVGECEVTCCTSSLPEQVHISLSDHPEVMTVMWTTLDDTPGVVEWGPSATDLGSRSAATQDTYTQFGWRGYLHTAAMSNLSAGATYFYRVGDGVNMWSQVFSFSTLPLGVGTSERPLRVASIADMGTGPESDDTVRQVIQLAEGGQIDLVIHNGDISYADGNMAVWDAFFRKIEPYASRIPLLTTPGNHEFWFNFTAYRKRFAMPSRSATDSMYYRVDVGAAIRLFGMNTESVLDVAAMAPAQVDFLKAELAAEGPVWKIAYGHRPFYCSNKGGNDIPAGNAVLRKRAEDVLDSGGVSIVLSGHVHDYERTLPTKNGVPTQTDYVNVTAPVYIVNGAAGNREGNDHAPGGAPWSPAAPSSRSHAVSFGLITIEGRALHYEQRYSANGSVFDNFTVTV